MEFGRELTKVIQNGQRTPLILDTSTAGQKTPLENRLSGVLGLKKRKARGERKRPGKGRNPKILRAPLKKTCQ